ncbi:MAG: class I SAM-dependent methyltransferase [Candidatus Hodarchaeota archaeon]
MRSSKVISNKKKKIMEKYDSTSDFYDNRYKKIQEEKYKILLSNFQMVNNIILDAGCGSGLFFDFILKQFKEDQIKFMNYIGIDISSKMLKRFVKKRKKSSEHLKLNLILADIENLPIRENKIDSIYSITSLQNLPNLKKGIIEIIKVSKHMANFYLSILKKTLNLESLVSFLEQNITNLRIIDMESIEDFIVQGNVIKN